MTAPVRPAAALLLALAALAAPAETREGAGPAPEAAAEAGAPAGAETATPDAPTPEAPAAPGDLPLEARLALRAAFDDPRPPAAAYVVLDGARIETPLAPGPADPARGAALFADPEAAGCVVCHAAPGLARLDAIPRLLRERLPRPAAAPPAEAEAAAVPEDAFADATESAPAATPTPRLNPRRAPPPPDPLALPEENLPPILPLPVGPDLAGVADRLDPAELRLIVVNPRLRDPASPMPAYHHVDPARARRAPGFRQPWLSPVQIEDVLAYLRTLDTPEPETAPAPEATPAPAATTPD